MKLPVEAKIYLLKILDSAHSFQTRNGCTIITEMYKDSSTQKFAAFKTAGLMSFSLKDCALLLRPTHWLKNLLIFAPPFFGGILFSEADTFIKMVQAFLAF